MVSKKTEDRLRFFWLIVVGIFCILVVRLGALQLVQASDYRTLSEENRVRIIPVRAPRGEIVDRNGAVLARSKQVFSIQLNRDPNQGDYQAVSAAAFGSAHPILPGYDHREYTEPHQSEPGTQIRAGHHKTERGHSGGYHDRGNAPGAAGGYWWTSNRFENTRGMARRDRGWPGTYWDLCGRSARMS